MDVRFDEASMSSRPVLDGTYDTQPGMLPPPLHMSLESPTDKQKQRDIAQKQADLKRVGASAPLPSVRVPGGVNEDMHSVLHNTCPTTRALHIQQRCAAIHGKTFMDVKGVEFADAKGNMKPYSISDLRYDLKKNSSGHSNLALPPKTLTDAQVDYHAHSLAATREYFDAHSLIQTGEEPMSRSEMLLRNDKPQWLESELLELQSMERTGCYEWVPVSQVPSGTKILTNKMVYKKKPDLYKSRLVIRGFSQDLADVGCTFAPVCRMETVRALLNRANRFQWHVRQLDIKTAFLEAPLLSGGPVYMSGPEGHERPGYVCRLRRALYGLKSSPRAWNKELHSYLLSQGFSPSKSDACLYYNSTKTVYLAVYVDDILVVSSTESASDSFVATMKSRFIITDCGVPKTFLGIQIDYDRRRGILSLKQTNMIESLMRRYSLTPKHVSTPMDADTKLTAQDDAEKKPDPSLYRSKVGSCMYIQTSTRPDIAFAVKELSRYLSNPSWLHMRAADRLLYYLYATRHVGLTYDATVSDELTSYSDADWAGQLDNRRSTSGRVHMLNGAAIMWTSRQQRCISLSSAEAEYVALSEAGRDIMWLRRLLTELKSPAMNPTPVFEDNNSAIKWTQDSHSWARSRHIDTSYHAIRQWCDDKHIDVKKVDTSSQLADLLTKSLSVNQHVKLSSLVLGSPDICSSANDHIFVRAVQSAAEAFQPALPHRSVHRRVRR
jgi:hypothetical protein